MTGKEHSPEGVSTALFLPSINSIVPFQPNRLQPLITGSECEPQLSRPAVKEPRGKM
jgi:hypothetical protein